jgi:hypothetical protein
LSPPRRSAPDFDVADRFDDADRKSRCRRITGNAIVREPAASTRSDVNRQAFYRGRLNGYEIDPEME